MRAAEEGDVGDVVDVWRVRVRVSEGFSGEGEDSVVEGGGVDEVDG